MSFNFEEYQGQAVKSIRDETTLEMLALLLASHVDAVSKLKYTALRSGVMNTDDLYAELGECLWCIAAIAHKKRTHPVRANVDGTGLFALKKLIQHSSELLYDIGDAQETFWHLSAAFGCINAIAQAHNLDISAIASINLAKVAH